MAVSAVEALEAIAEIEQSTPDQVKQMRSSARISVRAKVIAQPANASQRKRFQTQGVLGDISHGGCLILFSEPLRVGDIYRLTFDKKTLNVEPTFGRCLRCRLIREDAFEAGFSFFSRVELTNADQPSPTTELFD